jgi:hypothetical protein
MSGNLTGGGCPLEVRALRQAPPEDGLHRAPQARRVHPLRDLPARLEHGLELRCGPNVMRGMVAEIWKDRVLTAEEIETIVEDDRYVGMGLTICALFWEWKRTGGERQRSITAEADKRSWVFWLRPGDEVPMATWDPYEIQCRSLFMAKKPEEVKSLSAHERADIIRRNARHRSRLGDEDPGVQRGSGRSACSAALTSEATTAIIAASRFDFTERSGDLRTVPRPHWRQKKETGTPTGKGDAP